MSRARVGHSTGQSLTRRLLARAHPSLPRLYHVRNNTKLPTHKVPFLTLMLLAPPFQQLKRRQEECFLRLLRPAPLPNEAEVCARGDGQCAL